MVKTYYSANLFTKDEILSNEIDITKYQKVLKKEEVETFIQDLIKKCENAIIKLENIRETTLKNSIDGDSRALNKIQSSTFAVGLAEERMKTLEELKRWLDGNYNGDEKEVVEFVLENKREREEMI